MHLRASRVRSPRSRNCGQRTAASTLEIDVDAAVRFVALTLRHRAEEPTDMEWPASKEREVEWRGEISDHEAKGRIAQKMAERLKDGDVVGVGSGSTSLLTLHALVDTAQQHGWRFTAITTPLEMEMNCANLRVPTSDLLQQRPDWSFDGADEIDDALNMIKGRGGAMLREKIIMASSPERYV